MIQNTREMNSFQEPNTKSASGYAFFDEVIRAEYIPTCLAP